jgi:LysM repeat protein
MTYRLPFIRLIALLAAFLPLLAHAQVQPLQVQLANLRSDMDRIDQTVRALRIEVEALQRENRQLTELLRTELSNQPADVITRAQLDSLLASYERRIQAANKSSRDTLVNEVSKEIETLAEQTQKAISALSRAIGSQPQMQQVVTFNDDFPSTGTTYTVKRGDTLGRIARENGSRVDWIRNANRLATDTIFPGQELFIPLQN